MRRCFTLGRSFIIKTLTLAVVNCFNFFDQKKKNFDQSEKWYFGTKSLTPFDCSNYRTTFGGEGSEIKKKIKQTNVSLCFVDVLSVVH